MSTEVPAQSPDDAAAREATQQGLAALALGSLLVIVAPLTGILSAEIWAHSDKSPGIVRWHAFAARISVVVVSMVGLSGLGFAIRAWRFRDGDRRRNVWARAGLIVALAGFVLWLLAAAALLNTTESLLQNLQ